MLFNSNTHNCKYHTYFRFKYRVKPNQIRCVDKLESFILICGNRISLKFEKRDEDLKRSSVCTSLKLTRAYH